MPRTAAKIQDGATHRIYTELKRAFPDLPDEPAQVIYRYNPVSIRVRVVSPRFAGKGTAERERIVTRSLKHVPKETLADITLLLMLAPDEVSELDLMNREFDDPSDSYL